MLNDYENEINKLYPQLVDENGVLLEPEEFDILSGGGYFSIKSGGAISGNVSSIMLDGTENSKNGRGFNFVVYDNVLKRIVDSSNFSSRRIQSSLV